MTFNLDETYFSEKFAIFWPWNCQKIAQIEFFGHFFDFALLVFLDFPHNDRWTGCFLTIRRPSQCILSFLQWKLQLFNFSAWYKSSSNIILPYVQTWKLSFMGFKMYISFFTVQLFEKKICVDNSILCIKKLKELFFTLQHFTVNKFLKIYIRNSRL